MTRAETIRKFPKSGWRNLLARHLAGMTKRPAPTQFLEYQTQTTLHLPFAGEWYVYWGGRSVAWNRHVVVRDQRFAYDFLILARGHAGQSYRGSGENNAEYYCFGQPIYAPANGAVVKAENELPDNTPGEMNPKAVLGNCVILDHGRSEFSFLAHFRQGTVVVRDGERVRCGQLLAQCGNSGNSSEPHLHYHLQNTPVPFKGDGLPAFFVEYAAGGKPVARGEPVARQTVRSQREFSGQ
ncbi:MAG: M23 family metallopeptidase [Candidatus Sulfotelmatobacter sp.]